MGALTLNGKKWGNSRTKRPNLWEPSLWSLWKNAWRVPGRHELETSCFEAFLRLFSNSFDDILMQLFYFYIVCVTIFIRKGQFLEDSQGSWYHNRWGGGVIGLYFAPENAWKPGEVIGLYGYKCSDPLPPPVRSWDLLRFVSVGATSPPT